MQVVRVTAGENQQTFTLQHLLNGRAYDLTGATLTAVLRRTDLSAPTDSNVTGTLVILGGTNGYFLWTPSAADCATPGNYELQPISTVTGSPNKVSRGQSIHVVVSAQR